MSNNCVRMTFGIHNHQPVGNFEHVMEESYTACYQPFLAALNAHPTINTSLHHSGCLLEWIEKKHPEYIDDLARLVERGQVEILGGGFYEPILSVIPRDDALEQLNMMTDWAAKRLGVQVRGIWLPERIWEPALPELLTEAKVEFTIADETHFRFAGVPREKIIGYYVTERNGCTTRIFPIDKVLRYKIPFDSPDRVKAYLEETRQRFTKPVITYADDGEKFGVWPETHEWVYGKGWLEKFLTMLEQTESIKLVHYTDIIDSDPPTGRMYLPTASYHEMTEWALPVEAGTELYHLHEEAKRSGGWERIAPFIRGGFWDNFLGKYPESNRLHKRMLRASRKTKAAAKRTTRREIVAEARRHVLRSQCNCAYWHGLFGGLYLNYLRHGIIREMTQAEKLADQVLGLPQMEITDHDADGNDEVVIDTEHLSVVLKPSYGGSVYELIDRRTGHNLTDVLARRREIYHDKVASAPSVDTETKTIHQICRAKEEGLAKLLFYDWYDRYSSLDHFPAPWASAESFATSRYGEQGDFVNQPFTLKSAERQGGSFVVEMERQGGLYPQGLKHPLRVIKRVVVSLIEPKLEVFTTVQNLGEAIDLRLARQWNMTLLAGDAEDRRLTVKGERLPMNRSGLVEDLATFTLEDEWQNLRVSFEMDEPISLLHYPVETISQSEGGFERTYQGTALALISSFRLGAAEEKCLTLKLLLEPIA